MTDPGTTGSAPTGRGPGRPPIGPSLHVRLGDLTEQVDAWATHNRVRSRAEAVRRLVALALADDDTHTRPQPPVDPL